MGEVDIIAYKVDALEKENQKVYDEIKEIKAILAKIELKMSGIPDGGLNCQVHNIRITDLTRRTELLEAKLETMHTKIVTWSAIASVVLFLISNIALPYIQKHMSEAHPDHSDHSDTHASTWYGYPFPSPEPFSYTNYLTKK